MIKIANSFLSSLKQFSCFASMESKCFHSSNDATSLNCYTKKSILTWCSRLMLHIIINMFASARNVLAVCSGKVEELISWRLLPPPPLFLFNAEIRLGKALANSLQIPKSRDCWKRIFKASCFSRHRKSFFLLHLLTTALKFRIHVE